MKYRAKCTHILPYLSHIANPSFVRDNKNWYIELDCEKLAEEIEKLEKLEMIFKKQYNQILKLTC